jgi:hypothetical protein
LITDNDVTAYDRDGVVCLRQAFDPAWVKRLRAAVERDLARPDRTRPISPKAAPPAASSATCTCGGMILTSGRPRSTLLPRPSPLA